VKLETSSGASRAASLLLALVLGAAAASLALAELGDVTFLMCRSRTLLRCAMASANLDPISLFICVSMAEAFMNFFFKDLQKRWTLLASGTGSPRRASSL
jgi:hypothetical protein